MGCRERLYLALLYWEHNQRYNILFKLSNPCTEIFFLGAGSINTIYQLFFYWRSYILFRTEQMKLFLNMCRVEIILKK